MILCLTNLSYKNLNFESFLNKIYRLDIRNIEIVPALLYTKTYTKKNIKKTKYLLNKFDMNIKSFQSIFFKINMKYKSNKKNINHLTNHFKKVVNLAHELNVKNLSIGTCPTRFYNKNNEIVFNLNLNLFKKLSSIASKKKITISLEPVSRKYGNFFLNNIDEAFNFINKLGKNNIKLLLDTGNCKTEKLDYKKKFKQYRKFINHVQLSNPKMDLINVKEIRNELKFFKATKFKKTVTIEHFSNSLTKMRSNQKLIENLIK